MVRPQDSPVVKQSTWATDMGEKPDRIFTSIFMQPGEAPVTEGLSMSEKKKNKQNKKAKKQKTTKQKQTKN